jgi:ferrous-iron efflux pump FieF
MSEQVWTFKQKEKAILVSLIIGIVLMIPNIIAALTSNSLIMLTDVFQGASEVLAIFFAYIAIRKVSKGTNLVYNYGYGKLEAFSSLFIAVVIGISLIVILISVGHGILKPEKLAGIGVLIGIGFNFIGFLINSWQWLKFRKIAQAAFSPIIKGQSDLYRSKFIMDLGETLTLTCGFMLRNLPFAHFIDPIGALVLSGFLLYSAYTLFSTSMDNLMDRTLEESLQTEILKVLAQHFNDYRNIHDIRSRRSGADIFIELYLEFDDHSKMELVMNNIQQITADIKEIIRNCHVNVIPCREKPAQKL